MRILIAEDGLTARLILTGLLHKFGHEVIATTNGAEAWEIIQQPDSPRVVILDWMMPEMDGTDVCKKIRAMGGPYTYVIMQSAKTEKKDIDMGFSVGVDDYLTKPLDSEILRHKIHVAERVLKYETKLSLYAKEMESLANERARQLIHTDRLATLGTLSAGVAHEINNPLTFIAGNAQTMERAWNQVAPQLQEQNEQMAFILEEFPKMLTGIHTGVNRISKIVSGLKRFARQEKYIKHPFEISTAITTSLEFCHSKLKANIQVERSPDDSLPQVFGDIQQIEQVLINLIMNAADIMKSLPAGHLGIKAIQEGAMIRISVQDNGPGLPHKLLNTLVNPFFTTKSEGTGLGLSISNGIIEEHGGQFSAHNIPGGGACFEFTLPKYTNQSESLSEGL